MGWLERWDKRNQVRADELMRNPNAGLEDPPARVWLAIFAVMGWPGLVVAVVVGLVRLWRRRVEGGGDGATPAP